MLNRQIQDLKQATQSRDTVDNKLTELASAIEAQNIQIHQLDNFIEALTRFHELKPVSRPYLVKSDKSQKAAG